MSSDSVKSTEKQNTGRYHIPWKVKKNCGKGQNPGKIAARFGSLFIEKNGCYCEPKTIKGFTDLKENHRNTRNSYD